MAQTSLSAAVCAEACGSFHSWPCLLLLPGEFIDNKPGRAFPGLVDLPRVL